MLRNAGDLPVRCLILTTPCQLLRKFMQRQCYNNLSSVIDWRSLGECTSQFGYTEVFQATQLEQIAPETYETAIRYLQQGLKLSRAIGRNSESSFVFLSIRHLPTSSLSQPQAAIKYLDGLQSITFRRSVSQGFELG